MLLQQLRLPLRLQRLRLRRRLHYHEASPHFLLQRIRSATMTSGTSSQCRGLLAIVVVVVVVVEAAQAQRERWHLR
jgi:hypothetical protein